MLLNDELEIVVEGKILVFFVSGGFEAHNTLALVKQVCVLVVERIVDAIAYFKQEVTIVSLVSNRAVQS